MKVSGKYVNCNTSYVVLHLKNWMCVTGGFSQIRSHILSQAKSIQAQLLGLNFTIQRAMLNKKFRSCVFDMFNKYECTLVYIYLYPWNQVNMHGLCVLNSSWISLIQGMKVLHLYST